MTRRLALLMCAVVVASCDRALSPPTVMVDVAGPRPLPPLELAPASVAVVALEKPDPDLRESSTLVLAFASGRSVAFVANEETDAVHTIDLEKHLELARTDLSGRPAQMLLTKDGHLAVALRDQATVAVFGMVAPEQALVPLATMSTHDEPIALATSPDGRTLHVASGWGHALESFDVVTKQKGGTVMLRREPRALWSQ